MSSRIADAGTGLTEKEKQTLRLIVRGHDAKSIARHLDLSVHTVNERLRAARRKMAVSSSREAARLLLDAEGDRTPQPLVPDEIGDAPVAPSAEEPGRPLGGGRFRRRVAVATGVLAMILAAAFALLAPLPQQAPPPATPSAETGAATPSTETEAARRWLELVDQGRWEESWKASGTAFRRLNTAQTWTNASEKVRVPLGALVSRTLLSQENLPAPPDGYEVVKFRSSFANKAQALETVTLEREGDAWRVVGVTIG